MMSDRKETLYSKKIRILAKQLDALPTINEMGYTHQYLLDKRISLGIDVRSNTDKQLLIPIYDSHGNLHNAQYIEQDGSKHLASSTTNFCGMYIFAKSEKTKDVILGKSTAKDIFIVVGVAAGHSVHEATGSPVAVAFDANNLHSVASHFKQAYPDTNIHICTDNNRANNVNIGREAAERVSETLDINVILPRFKDVHGNDFNDLKNQEGKQAIIRQIHIGVSLYRQRLQGDVVRSSFKSGTSARGNDLSHTKSRKSRSLSKKYEHDDLTR